MQEMTLKHTRELDIFYKEHRKKCSNCEDAFIDGDCAHLGYLKNRQYIIILLFIIPPKIGHKIP